MASTEKDPQKQEKGPGRRRSRRRRPSTSETEAFYAKLEASREIDFAKKVRHLVEIGETTLTVELDLSKLPVTGRDSLSPVISRLLSEQEWRVEEKRAIEGSRATEARVSIAPRMPAMIDAMMPTSVPTAPMVLQARRNTQARTSLIAEFGLLTSAEIAELNQSKAENRAALASRWKGEGRIFSVRHDGRDWFPGFQFHPDGSPRETIAATLSALGGPRGWETALWFTAANGYLDGRRPVDLLEEDSTAVVEAAAHEAEEVYF